MNKYLLSFLLLSALSSCTSEYTERLEKAIALKREFELIMNNENIKDKDYVSRDLKTQIQIHAKLSGNEVLFYNQLGFENN